VYGSSKIVGHSNCSFITRTVQYGVQSVLYSTVQQCWCQITNSTSHSRLNGWQLWRMPEQNNSNTVDYYFSTTIHSTVRFVLSHDRESVKVDREKKIHLPERKIFCHRPHTT